MGYVQNRFCWEITILTSYVFIFFSFFFFASTINIFLLPCDHHKYHVSRMNHVTDHLTGDFISSFFLSIAIGMSNGDFYCGQSEKSRLQLMPFMTSFYREKRERFGKCKWDWSRVRVPEELGFGRWVVVIFCHAVFDPWPIMKSILSWPFESKCVLELELIGMTFGLVEFGGVWFCSISFPQLFIRSLIT